MKLPALLAALAALLSGPVTLESRIVRAAPAAGDDVAGYVRIANAGEADRLLGVSCACAEKVEVHRVDRSGPAPDMVTMPGIDVPAHGALEIRPGSALHLMLMGVKAPIPAGSSVELTFRFEKAGTIKADFAAVEDTRAAWDAARAN